MSDILLGCIQLIRPERTVKKLKDLHELSLRARKAFYELSVSPLEQRNRAILFLSDLLKEHGYTDIKVVKDLAELDRVIICRLKRGF